LTKPGTHENARNQLKKISHKSIVFLTGLCVLNTTHNRTQKDCVRYTVHFRDLTEDEIERYLNKETPYDCAGSFKSEGYGISLVQRMEGEDPTSLIGLPLIRLSEMLRNENLSVP
jgi:MAF protein